MTSRTFPVSGFGADVYVLYPSITKSSAILDESKSVSHRLITSILFCFRKASTSSRMSKGLRFGLAQSRFNVPKRIEARVLAQVFERKLSDPSFDSAPAPCLLALSALSLRGSEDLKKDHSHS